MRVIGGTADKPFFRLEAGVVIGVHHIDELADLGHRLGADAVAGKKEELAGRHVTDVLP